MKGCSDRDGHRMWGNFETQYLQYFDFFSKQRLCVGQVSLADALYSHLPIAFLQY